MVADEALGGLRHDGGIEGTHHLPGAVMLQGERRAAVDDPIDIVAAGGREARMKGRLGLAGCENGDRERPQMGVERIPEPVAGPASLQVGVGNLPEGMDPAVGPSGPDDDRVVAGQALDRVLDRALDRGVAVALALPAMERGAVIFDEEAVARHGLSSRQSGSWRNWVTAEKIREPQGRLALELEKERPDCIPAAGNGEVVIEADARRPAARLDGGLEQP